MLEYAEAVWDPLTKSKIRDIEQIQNNAIGFINNLKGHTDTVSEARNQRQLQSLQDVKEKPPIVFVDQDSPK